MALRWSMSRDGECRASVRVEHRISLREMALMVADAIEDGKIKDVEGLVRREAEDAVRSCLLTFGTEFWGHTEHLPDDLVAAVQARLRQIFPEAT